jgi:hypothetical protein
MPEEPTTPDPLQGFLAALNRGDAATAAAAVASPGSVFDFSLSSLGVYEGREAMRGFVEDWLAPFRSYRIEVREWRDLGNAVTLHVLHHRGQPARGTGLVELLRAYVTTWTDGLIERMTSYPDIDEAHAAAELLAEERG